MMKRLLHIVALALGLAVLAAPTGAAAPTFVVAPTFVGAASESADPTYALTVATPNGVSGGQVLVAVVGIRQTAKYPITAPSGWTLVRRDSSSSGASLSQAVYVKVAGSSEPASYTWSFRYKTAAAGGIVAYAGVDPSSPVIAHSGRYSSSSTVMTGPSVSVGVPGAALIGFFGNNGTRSTKPPAGMTEQFDVIADGTWGTSVAAANTLLPSAGSTGDRVAVSETQNSSSIGQLVALRPAGSGTGSGGTTATPPESTVRPSLSGTAGIGSVLTTNGGSWSGTQPMTLAYRWQRCDSSGTTCAPIGGATASSYTIASADGGHRLAVVVVATNEAGSASSASVASPTVPLPPPSEPPPSSADYFVSPSGSDSNPGTLDRPFRPLQKALNTVNAGQTIVIRAGEYPEWVTAGRGGTPSAPVRVQGYPGEKPVITGRLKVTANHVHVSGLVFDGSTDANASEVLIYVYGGDYVRIFDNEIRRAVKSGIFISASDGTEVTGNWIHDNGTRWNLDHGVYWASGNGGLIADNVIERNFAYGIQFYGNVDNVTITRNKISGSGRGGIVIDTDTENTADGNQVVSNTIFNNVEYGIRTGMYRVPGTGNAVRNNVIYGNPKGNIWDPFGVLLMSGNVFTAP
jgi:parallel beta-helix repeat protein